METADKNKEANQMWTLTARNNNGFLQAVAVGSAESCVCVASRSTEAKAAAGRESRPDWGSPLPWYLSSSFRGYRICAHLQMLQKNPVPQLCPTPVLLNHLLFNLALVRKEGVILCSTHEGQCFGNVTGIFLKNTFAHLVCQSAGGVLNVRSQLHRRSS